MAFLRADLVAATVVWIHVKYYGWRYALCVAEMVAFEIDYTFWLNVGFVVLAAALLRARDLAPAESG